ncbi:oxidative stress-induced growth inhibitor 2 isoform X3 [Agrilus planipennis]|nr:oxidative stress-induced growth inhibitor 2 isoform X2 [Agrilus planipennis]XP_025832136.1 oxidative stress-induced growth inhibitor 2 isoform X3 [Agrilus planipennis]
MKAKEGGHTEMAHKNVIVIGNGPSGLSLSYMLQGNIPYVVSADHPDELLAARLKPFVGKSLVHQNLRFLAEGLEGRSTNMVSLLLDALIHPYADMGLELQPLVEWRPDGNKMEHLVLGKGPPGGAWHTMDPQILTLSLGSWMSLPGLPYNSRDGSEKRAFAGNIAKYYEDYATKMGLQENFVSNTIVTKVKPLRNAKSPENQISAMDVDDCAPESKCDRQQCMWVKKVKEDTPEKRKLCLAPELAENCRKIELCPLSNALYLIGCGRKKKLKGDRCHLSCNIKCNPSYNIFDSYEKVSDNDVSSSSSNNRCRNLSYSEKSSSNFHDELPGRFNYYCRSLSSYEGLNTDVPCSSNSVANSSNKDADVQPVWLVEVYDKVQQRYTTYTCNNLVLANGASDIPNKLNLSNQKPDPDWFAYTVRDLEIALDNSFRNNSNLNPDPVLVVGAGLSAADAIIAARGRNIPVLHVFKSKSEGLNKQLPENMYPEYHKVHQMMVDGGSSYPFYKALPGYTLTDFNASKKIVELTSNTGKSETVSVSFAAILIGSRPDLSFLPENFNLGVNRNLPVDCKTNPIDIDQLTHAVNGYNGLYVMGPLVGDNFVRFIPGGALAILSDLYRKYGY